MLNAKNVAAMDKCILNSYFCISAHPGVKRRRSLYAIRLLYLRPVANYQPCAEPRGLHSRAILHLLICLGCNVRADYISEKRRLEVCKKVIAGVDHGAGYGVGTWD